MSHSSWSYVLWPTRLLCPWGFSKQEYWSGLPCPPPRDLYSPLNSVYIEPILWSPDVKNWLIGKDPDAGKDWGQEEKGTTENEMVGWHHQLDGHESGWTLGVGDGQGGLVCCGSWGCKESDMTERLNWTELNKYRERCSFHRWNWFPLDFYNGAICPFFLRILLMVQMFLHR